MNPHQRINIQYTIGLDELPEEVSRVYKKSLQQLRSIELPELNDRDILNSSVVKIIDQARQDLAKTDLMLSDVQSIVNSYVEYEISLATQNAEPTIPEQQYENAGQIND